ncbi:MAG: PTS sugar transporter subunit IIA [Calditrichia bacterium]
MKWTDILKPEAIKINFVNKSRDEVLRELLEYGKEQGVHQYNVDDVLQVLLQREKLISTGIGHGIALPHAKCDFCNDFISLMGIIPDGIDYNSADGKPVTIICAVIGPKEQPNKNIKLLARIARILDQEQVRESVKNMKNPDEVFHFLKKIEDNI